MTCTQTHFFVCTGNSQLHSKLHFQGSHILCMRSTQQFVRQATDPQSQLKSPGKPLKTSVITILMDPIMKLNAKSHEGNHVRVQTDRQIMTKTWWYSRNGREKILSPFPELASISNLLQIIKGILCIWNAWEHIHAFTWQLVACMHAIPCTWNCSMRGGGGERHQPLGN